MLVHFWCLHSLIPVQWIAICILKYNQGLTNPTNCNEIQCNFKWKYSDQPSHPFTSSAMNCNLYSEVQPGLNQSNHLIAMECNPMQCDAIWNKSIDPDSFIPVQWFAICILHQGWTTYPTILLNLYLCSGSVAMCAFYKLPHQPFKFKLQHQPILVGNLREKRFSTNFECSNVVDYSNTATSV